MLWRCRAGHRRYFWPCGHWAAMASGWVYLCIPARHCATQWVSSAETVFIWIAAQTASMWIRRPPSSLQVDILIAPSMYGIPVDLPEARGYLLIEDLAQSLGAGIAGARIGMRGEMGICSFYATKLITSGGQGGAVISRDKSLIDKVRDYREFDCRNDARVRFNFQMTDIQAAIGRVQLGRLPEFLERREKWFSMYLDSGLNIIEERRPQVQPVRYRIVMRCNRPSRIIASLAAANIRAIVPIEEYELLDGAARYPEALALTNTTVSLPAHPGLREEDVARIGRVAKQAS